MGVATYVVNMPDFEKLGLGQSNNVSGTQRIKGQHLSVPAETGDYEIKWSFDEDIYITDVKYSQSGWRYEDNWDLKIADTPIFETIYTKEIAESEVFHCYCYVAANTEITLILHNISGNSRDIWANLHYISKKIVQEPPPEEPPPEEPEPEEPEPNPPDQNPEPSNKPDGVPDINHDYNWMIVMRWESNVYVDMDLRAWLETIHKEVYFSHKTYSLDKHNKVWLDQDNAAGSHKGDSTRQNNPEVITILGKPCEFIKIYVQNYSLQDNQKCDDLKENVTIEIFSKDDNNTNILKNKFSVLGSKFTSDNYDIDFCTIDLNTGEVKKCEGIDEDAF